jgi:predicted HicB family RNase H-like nuclease
METITRRPASFRLRSDLMARLRQNAARENRTLNNYVESVLLDVVYNEPNEDTKEAIMEAMNRKEYPAEDVYDNVDDMFKALGVKV